MIGSSKRSKIAAARSGKRLALKDLIERQELVWEDLAEDGDNDPVTVARCKHLHDAQIDRIARLLERLG